MQAYASIPVEEDAATIEEEARAQLAAESDKKKGGSKTESKGEAKQQQSPLAQLWLFLMSHAAEVVQQPGWLTLPSGKIEALIRSDFFNIPEVSSALLLSVVMSLSVPCLSFLPELDRSLERVAGSGSRAVCCCETGTHRH